MVRNRRAAAPSSENLTEVSISLVERRDVCADPVRRPAEAGLRVLGWPAGQATDRNPYVRLMYGAFTPPYATVTDYLPFRSGSTDAEIFHIQWPEAIFEGRFGRRPWMAAAKAVAVLNRARAMRRSGRIVALTLHNLQPHRNLSIIERSVWRWYFSALLKQVDLLISLSSRALSQFQELYPSVRNAESCVIPHPHYRTCYPAPLPQEDARALLGLAPAGRLIGVLGAIRPSKQVPQAIRSFSAMTEVSADLLIVGQCSRTEEPVIKALADQDDRVHFVNRSLDDQALVDMMSAVDLCLINQESTLNSGTAMLALSYDRPVIAPAVGSLVELQQYVGARWVRLFTPPLTANKLETILREPLPGAHDRVDLNAFNPEHLSLRLLKRFWWSYERRGRFLSHFDR